MKFTLTSGKEFLPNELREEFTNMIKQEIDARDPAEGARLLYDEEPEQLQFNFTFSSKTSS